MVPRLKITSCGILLALTACQQNIASLSCNDVERETVRISKGSLIKITHQNETSRTASELVCHGMGIYANDDDTPTRYRAYVDDDHEVMVAYDTKEADAQADAEQQREDDADVERITSEMNQSIDDAWTNHNPE